jgi:hypothetical protein
MKLIEAFKSESKAGQIVVMVILLIVTPFGSYIFGISTGRHMYHRDIAVIDMKLILESKSKQFAAEAIANKQSDKEVYQKLQSYIDDLRLELDTIAKQNNYILVNKNMLLSRDIPVIDLTSRF